MMLQEMNTIKNIMMREHACTDKKQLENQTLSQTQTGSTNMISVIHLK